MAREEVIRLAKLAATKVVDYDLIGNPITDADVVMLGAYGPFIERFAELVAAEYKQDAERYRKLIALLQEAYDGNVIELENSFIVDCSMVSGYKTERRVQAVLGWADTRDEPLNLDAAIDAAMEKVK